MKKLLCAICGMLCLLCCLCACDSQTTGQSPDPGPPTFPINMKLDIPRSHFNNGEDVTVEISLGSPESFALKADGTPDLSRKAVIVFSKEMKVTEQSDDFHIVKEFNNFVPYIWEENGDEIIYKFTQELVVPEDMYEGESGRFYCSLYSALSTAENCFGENARLSAHGAIDYVKDEGGITLTRPEKTE